VTSAEVIRVLRAAGWRLARVKGSHHHFRHDTSPGTVTVPHPRKDLPRGTPAFHREAERMQAALAGPSQDGRLSSTVIESIFVHDGTSLDAAASAGLPSEPIATSAHTATYNADQPIRVSSRPPLDPGFLHV
jgi:predicted RNA binding protein YcfA (HicA-like mRNA interferase family)